MISVAVLKVLTSFCVHEGVIFNSRTHFSGCEKKLFCLNVTLALYAYTVYACTVYCCVCIRVWDLTSEYSILLATLW